ncbi:MAG: DUF3450 domain-containing protein [Gammaproteobacteria bacterium]|nr:DUF3450 domain-containing protein [Gammaproteobacteria bacterium]MCP5198618.1 DUF3450 domain-containing protein [Gammaproteobacteria bacterium]
MNNPVMRAVALRLALLAAFPLAAGAADKVDTLVQVGEQRADEGAAAQKQIEQMSDQAGDIEAEYKQVLKVVEGLEVYNGLLQKQVDNQTAEMNALRDSMDKVALIERQIVPLMMQMIETLGEFVSLDVPFLTAERNDRVERLRAMMERSDVTAAEKFRQIIEAYQIENEYGRTIEAYKGTLDIDGGKREVNFLRVGRIALLYQTDGGELTGAWNQDSRSWEALPPETYKQAVAMGLRIARKQVAPDLLVLPVAAPKGAAQ